MDERATRKQMARYKIIVITAGISVLMVTIGILAFFLLRPKVKEEIWVEAGSAIPAVEEFLLREYKHAEIVSGIDETTPMDTVADYVVTIRIRNKEYVSVLHVQDMVAPVAACSDALLVLGQPLNIEDFDIQIDDVTETKVFYKEQPDVDKTGEQQVTFRIIDEGENVTEVTANLVIVEDTTAPVIEGVGDLTVIAGESISYKRGVSVTDDYDGEPTLIIDNSGVDIYHPGKYTVIYKAVDDSGNESMIEATVTVKMPAEEEISEELIYAWADERLAIITTEDMTLYEKAYAIFRWVHDCIGYYDDAPKENWIQGAYYGLIKRSGDCYTYAMTAKVLLTRAGIPNMDIEKIPTHSRHYWNLIDLGDGWYHFDATRRVNKTEFFYVTDEELMAYSNSHGGSHKYDPSLYPEIN